MNKCLLCNKEFGINAVRTSVRRAIKPPRHPNRYKVIGYYCEVCECHNPTTFDKWRK